MDPNLINYLIQFNKPRFQDITPMFNDSVPFLVSGEMLMTTALMDKNYNRLLGGQSLHLIYICERLLNVFKKNNGTFEIVFFSVWENVFRHPELLLYRQIIMSHFKNNTTIPVHTFRCVFDPSFSDLIDKVRPGFLLYNLANKYQIAFFKKYQCAIVDLYTMFCSEFIFCLNADLPVVDLRNIKVDISVVKSYLLENNVRHEEFPDLLPYTVKIINKHAGIPEKLALVYKCKDIRELVICNAACVFLNDFSQQVNEVRLFLLYAIILENLKLQYRGCPVVQITGSKLLTVTEEILIWQKIIFALLKDCDDVDYEWKNICDIWQGTLLAVVYSSVTNPMFSENLGKLATFYEQYVDKINGVTNTKLAPYPIMPYKTQFCTFTMPYCREAVEIPLKPVKSEILMRFCDSFISHIKWADPDTSLEKETVYFDEVRHWHSKRPITDDYDHVKSDPVFDKNSADHWQIKQHQKQHASQSRWMYVYGTNLIGKAEIYETIICEEGSKKSVQKTKESKKAKEIKAKLMKDKAEEIRKNEMDKFTVLKKEYKTATDLKLFLKKLEFFADKVKTTESQLESSVLKAKVLDKIYSKTIKTRNISEEEIKQLFLVLRDILDIHNGGCALTAEQEKTVSKILYTLGFGDIVTCNKLHCADKTPNEALYTNEDSVRFQLRCLGPQLKKEVTGEFDADVGFVPDPWQEKLIHAIRNNQSALVVAPTSSGKTFASYYCMKRVLQQSKEGIVVYVSPTKALVNQVAATITVKFHGFTPQPGIATVGVFTRDYRTNALTSRILVTVPQCLEILLMSPRRYTWSKKIQYIIFDEVHCLKGSNDESVGITWERCLLLIRCPFLALSATIRNPESFHSWLSVSEKFKEQEDLRNGFKRRYNSRVHLVVYSERHSDLVKYTYLRDKGLQHCHPYSVFDQDVLKLHQGIPDGTNLSSLEALQLYDAIKAHAPHRVTGESELKTFFATHSKNGFITYKNVKDFERLLGKIFVELFNMEHKCYQQVLGDLQPAHSSTCLDVGFDYCKQNIMDLTSVLHKKNMLPAIIFSYTRDYIEILCEDVAEHFESLTVEIDRRDLKKQEKLEKKEKKELHKIEAKSGESSNSFKKVQKLQSLNLLEETPSYLKGVGIADSDDIACVTNRLERTGGYYRNMLVKAIKQGVAFHHAGLNNKFRSSIEMLFRMGLLRLVFATGTLAMGIHMPCKTVVICCDSPYMNSLEYHQMAGRAGRRGFDNEGNVIFMGLNKRRQKTLLTSKLPIIDGNFPLTITFIMRLLLLVGRVTDSKEQTEECVKKTLSSALTMLENSLSYKKFPMLRDQMKHFFCFGTQLLYLQKLIGLNGLPTKFCTIVTHLHYHEPANFAFVYILRNGAIRKMINDNIGDDNQIQWNLIVIMNFLFARLVLHQRQKNEEHDNSCVVLEPIPAIIKEALEQYNKQVKFVFNEYFASVSRYYTKHFGCDDKLPLSELRFGNGISAIGDNHDCILNKIRKYCQPRSICSAFCSLSSNGDDNLYSEQNLISNIRNDVCPDVKIVPIIDLDLEINSYAADFYRHGIKKAIMRDNGLKHGQDYALLNDFVLVLRTVVLALEELEPVDQDDVILHHFRVIQCKYEQAFRKEYPK